MINPNTPKSRNEKPIISRRAMNPAGFQRRNQKDERGRPSTRRVVAARRADRGEVSRKVMPRRAREESSEAELRLRVLLPSVRPRQRKRPPHASATSNSAGLRHDRREPPRSAREEILVLRGCTKKRRFGSRTGGFSEDDPKRIARALKASAERSKRRKAGPYQSAMSMLNFFVNRAGRNLPAERKRILEKAKVELRRVFGRD